MKMGPDHVEAISEYGTLQLIFEDNQKELISFEGMHYVGTESDYFLYTVYTLRVQSSFCY